MKAYSLWVVALITGLVACGPGVVKEEERPNFILVDIDSLRADRLENAPPAIQSLQARGTHFTHTITPAGWTLPSVSAILAGTPVPSELMESIATPSTTHTFPSILQRYGYEIGAAWGDTLVAAHPRAFTWFGTPETVHNLGTVEGVTRALQNGPQEPFLYFVHDIDLHIGLEQVPPARVVKTYDDRLKAYDQRLGKMLAQLDNTALTRETVVVLLSDHGNELFDHMNGIIGHGRLHWDTVLRVATVIADPRYPETHGTRVEQAISSLDLAPTILERAGVPKAHDMTGQSLLPALSGKAVPERKFYSITRYSAATIRDGQWKYTLQESACPPGTTQTYPPLRGDNCPFLYNVKDDPLERKNLIKDEPERAASMQADLLSWVKTQKTSRYRMNTKFEKKLKEQGYWEPPPAQ